ncbi:MAG: HD-GYP domain-containing protein [Lachnospiraceae bacterium]|nr:HD-GYP domain-containing protein [Lachnospiraceae bacterium]
MMFNTVFILSVRGGFNRLDPSDPNIGLMFDIVAILIMFFAVWLFHHLVIREIPRLAHVDVNVNWKIFSLPPAFFAVLSSLTTFLVFRYVRFLKGKTILILYGFTTIILFLFIWAFYVIIKNISATNEIKTLSVEVMEALAHTIDAKDEYTRGHSVRVAKYSRMLAEKMGLPAERCESVYYMGLLHDIGKIGVPNEIINSPTKLTDEEYDVIKTHPGIGFDILAEMKSHPELSTGARWHHERFDGGGYPDRKTNEEIPLEARIIAVADSYDAMTSNRSYRKYMPQEKVRSEIEKNVGKQFDPDVAETMLGVIDSDVDYVLHEW